MESQKSAAAESDHIYCIPVNSNVFSREKRMGISIIIKERRDTSRHQMPVIGYEADQRNLKGKRNPSFVSSRFWRLSGKFVPLIGWIPPAQIYIRVCQSPDVLQEISLVAFIMYEFFCCSSHSKEMLLVTGLRRSFFR